MPMPMCYHQLTSAGVSHADLLVSLDLLYMFVWVFPFEQYLQHTLTLSPASVYTCQEGDTGIWVSSSQHFRGFSQMTQRAGDGFNLEQWEQNEVVIEGEWDIGSYFPERCASLEGRVDLRFSAGLNTYVMIMIMFFQPNMFLQGNITESWAFFSQ